jgi:lysozyme
VLAIIGAIAAAWLWWQSRQWRPSEAVYADQGAYLAETAGEVNLRTLKALGADFVYLHGSIGADGKDAAFSRNFAAATAAGIPVGVVHNFDPCVPADGQSANFVVMVPRDAQLLPAAIALDKLADDCPRRVSEAAVESELITLINQIEIHTGAPVLLKPGKAFERRYGISAGFERNLWLSQNWLEPEYAGRPWLMWTANDGLMTEASDEPVAWVVVRP